MNYRIYAAMTAILCAAAVMPAAPARAESNQVLVTNTDELIAALADAKPGDEIILREGVYMNDKWLGKWAAFFAEASGTPEQHIIIRSEDPAHPATINGATQESKYALNIIGSYWEIRDLKIGESSKGIFLAKSEHSVISGCEVYNTGGEGIHVIDNSSYNLVENCWVHDTGTISPQYGEGVYIGSAKNATDYGFECHYNTVRGCKFGPNVAADHVDIKEFTHHNVVEYCTFDGTGIQGQNGGNSFVEVKGNDCTVRYNTGYRNGCTEQLYGFDLNVQLDGWGQNNKIYDNTLYLDTADCYVVKGWNCYTEVFRNTVEPAECVSNGNKVLQVRGYRLAGDANEDGMLNRDDLTCMQAFLFADTPPHISGENADLNGDGKISAKDLTLLKRRLLTGDTETRPEISVEYVKEEAGKWRLTDALGGRTITFSLTAKPQSTLNMAWGYWDPNADGGGKWSTVPLGANIADENGSVQITVDVPENDTRVALEIWDYSDASGDLDADSVTLDSVTTSSPFPAS